MFHEEMFSFYEQLRKDEGDVIRKDSLPLVLMSYDG